MQVTKADTAHNEEEARRKVVLNSGLPASSSIIIIGLGNPILGDDGFGWVVTQELESQIASLNLNPEIEYASLGGLSLMERLVGYDTAILIDTIHLGQTVPGTLYSFPFTELPDYSAGHTASSHDTTLKAAIQMGRSLGAHLPEVIWVVGVESESNFDFSDELSPIIADAVPGAVQIVIDLLQQFWILTSRGE
jgi:hydrogenase maturation protease